MQGTHGCRRRGEAAPPPGTPAPVLANHPMNLRIPRAGPGPPDRQPQDTLVELTGRRPAPAAPPATSQGQGREQLAQPCRKRAGGVRAWEPTPANPARSCSAILSLLIKHPRNREFTDVFSSPLSSRDTQNGKAKSSSESPGGRRHFGAVGVGGKRAGRAGRDRSRDSQQQSRRPGSWGAGGEGARVSQCVQECAHAGQLRSGSPEHTPSFCFGKNAKQQLWEGWTPLAVTVCGGWTSWLRPS